jgi:membrane-bound ClpP family serine protease
VAGELWSATSEEAIPEGAHIKVIGREGFSLVVEIIDDQD